MAKDKIWEGFKNKFIKDFKAKIAKISKEYNVSEEHAGCYLCNFEDQYICREYNGGCKAYNMCKKIYDGEVKI